MSDVFSNLAAQSLGSRVGMQPLIPPLFASAPQLLFDATLSASNDQPAVAAENGIFSITPSIVADDMAGTSEIEQPSEEIVRPEKRTTPPDLVPSDVPQKAISILSLHHLLYDPHLMHDRMEPITHLAQSSAPAPTIDESSSEDTPFTAFPQVNSIGDDVSRPSPIYRLLNKVHGAPLPLSIQSQEATPSNTENTGMPSSSIRYDDQKHTAENSFNAAPTNYEPQHTSPKDHPAIPTGDASHFQYLSPPSNKPVASLPIQPALSVSLPSLQPDAQSEHIVNRDDVLDQEYSSLAQPQVQSVSIPVRRDRFIAPIADGSASIYHASKPKPQTIADGQPGTQPEAAPQPLSRLDETSIKPLLDLHTVAKEQEELLQASQASEPTSVAKSVRAQFIDTTASAKLISNSSAYHPSNAQDAQHSPRDSSKQEAHRAKAEGEVPPIHITIGRVVVRATPTTQPTPIQKRGLRPAQSLSEYLKQREKGSR